MNTFPLIVSGGEYLEDNPITLPRNCSLVGDNLRRVIVRPQNQDRHMLKASNETYVSVLYSETHYRISQIHKVLLFILGSMRLCLMINKDYTTNQNFTDSCNTGDKFRGDNLFNITFTNHTGNNTTLQVGYFVQGGSSGTQGTIQEVTFTGPQASPYSTGS